MNEVTWRKSAARDVRPFFGTADFDTALENAQISLEESGAFSSETSYVVDDVGAGRLAPTIRFNFDPNGFAYESLKKTDLLMVVTVTQPFMKRVDVVDTFKIDKSLPAEVAVDPDLLKRLGGGSNIDIEIALFLSKHLPRRPGTPFLSGHWLSKKRFSIRPPKPIEEFDVEETDDATFVKLGYPPKTLYCVEYLGGFNEPVDKEKKCARVRVHSDIYKKLTATSSQRLSRPVLTMMAAEIACSSIAASYDDWKDADVAEPKSPLAALVKRLSRTAAYTLTDLKAMVAQPGMPKLRALLHADQASVRAIVEY